MHCHCGTNNRAPRWTFTDPCKPEVRPGVREESASPAWPAAPAMNARDTTKVYDTGCGPTLYRKCHSHNTPGKRHNNTWVEPLAGNCTTSSTRQREQVWQKSKILLKNSLWIVRGKNQCNLGRRGSRVFPQKIFQWLYAKKCIFRLSMEYILSLTGPSSFVKLEVTRKQTKKKKKPNKQKILVLWIEAQLEHQTI